MLRIIVVVAALCSTYVLSAMAADLSTPEGALKALEDAYVRKDIEAAVAAKDFRFEAREMLATHKQLSKPDEELVSQVAQTLELAFRSQMKTSGFPDFNQLRCAVTHKAQLRPDLVELTEECVFADGGKSHQTLHAANSAGGWRIVIMPE